MMMMIRYLKDLREKHENLKKRIHAFRLPLSPTGQKVMGFVYFTIPVIVGYYIMQVVYGLYDSINDDKDDNHQILTNFYLINFYTLLYLQWAIGQSEKNLKTLTTSKVADREKDISDQNKALGLLLDRHQQINIQNKKSQYYKLL